jgi:hypothetical protein
LLADDRSAALFIRVWLEDCPDDFRARVTAVGSPGSADRTVAVASSPREVLDAVSNWLDEFSVTNE